MDYGPVGTEKDPHERWASLPPGFTVVRRRSVPASYLAPCWQPSHGVPGPILHSTASPGTATWAPPYGGQDSLLVPTHAHPHVCPALPVSTPPPRRPLFSCSLCLPSSFVNLER